MIIGEEEYAQEREKAMRLLEMCREIEREHHLPSAEAHIIGKRFHCYVSEKKYKAKMEKYGIESPKKMTFLPENNKKDVIINQDK